MGRTVPAGTDNSRAVTIERRSSPVHAPPEPPEPVNPPQPRDHDEWRPEHGRPPRQGNPTSVVDLRASRHAAANGARPHPLLSPEAHATSEPPAARAPRPPG